MNIKLFLFYICMLALCLCIFPPPSAADAHDNKGQKEKQREELQKQVEEMRKKLEAWAMCRKKQADQVSNLSDPDHSEQMEPVDHQSPRNEAVQTLARNELQQPDRPSSHSKSKHEAAGSNRSRTYQKSKSDLRESRSEVRNIVRRHSDDSLIRNSHGLARDDDGQQTKRTKASRASTSPAAAGSRDKQHNAVAAVSKKPPSPVAASAAGRRPMVSQRRDQTLDDLQKLRDEMHAIVATNSDLHRPMRSEAHALRLASNVEAPREALRPMRGDPLLTRLSRKMKPEPDMWKRNLSNMLANKNPLATLHNNKQERSDFLYGYHGYWGETDPDAPQHTINMQSDQADHHDHNEAADQRGEASVLAIEAAPVETERSKQLYLMDVPHVVDQPQHQPDENARSVAASSNNDVMENSESGFDRDEQSPSSIYQYSTDHQHSGVRRNRSLSRRTTFHGPSTSSDQLAMDWENYGGSRTSVNHRMMQNVVHVQPNIDEEHPLGKDNFDEDEAVRLAMRQSLEEAESIERQEEEQLRIAMEHSVLDEIQRRQRKKKDKAKTKLTIDTQNFNKNKQPTSSTHLSYGSDEDPAIQKAIQNSLTDLR